MSRVSQRQAMVSYFNSLLTSEDGEKTRTPALASNPEPKPDPKVLVREDRREELQTLLDTVPALVENHVETPVETRTQVETQLETKVETKVETQTETATQTQTVVETQTQTQTAQTVVDTPVENMQVTVTETVTIPETQVAVATEVETATAVDTATETCVAVETEASAEQKWKNLETDAEFTALFFKVAGVTLAVPLVNLGGIYEPGTITGIFGKPSWYMGLMQLGEDKVSVVDTQKWMLPDIESPADRSYQYVIMLDKSEWCIGCDELIGTKNVSREAIRWREQPGARPWLAGIVKDEMCALIHVEELLRIFRKGLDMCKE